MLNKKGLSGLVVAVLLLAISLTIGGLVMGWMSSFADSSLSGASESSKIQEECLERSFKVISVTIINYTGGDNAADDKIIRLVIENSGEKNIKGFLFKFSTVGNDLFAFENASTANPVSELAPYSRKTYLQTSADADTGGTNTPLAGGAGRSNPPASTDYTINKIEVIPIIDVVVDVTKEVKCTDRVKEVTESAFVTTAVAP